MTTDPLKLLSPKWSATLLSNITGQHMRNIDMSVFTLQMKLALRALQKDRAD